MKKCRTAPRVAVAAPPLNDSGPSKPLATDCRTLLGLLPLSNHEARKAWLMSSTPQAKPAQKMASNALEEVATVVTAVPMNSPSFRNDDMIVRRWNQGRTRIAKDAQIRTKSDVQRLVQSLSELFGGNAQQTSHVHGEMALVGKASLQRNLADGQAVLAEKDRRPLHAAPDHILMNGHVERLAEKYFAVGNAQTGNPCNIAQGKIAGKAVLNKRQHVFQCAAGKPGASEARWPGFRDRGGRTDSRVPSLLAGSSQCVRSADRGSESGSGIRDAARSSPILRLPGARTAERSLEPKLCHVRQVPKRLEFPPG